MKSFLTVVVRGGREEGLEDLENFGVSQSGRFLTFELSEFYKVGDLRIPIKLVSGMFLRIINKNSRHSSSSPDGKK